jgi:hypothetical protein
VKIRNDLAVVRYDEAAAQDIPGISFSLNNHDGRRYSFCDLSSRKGGLRKCDGGGCYDDKRNSGEHKANLSAPFA